MLLAYIIVVIVAQRLRKPPLSPKKFVPTFNLYQGLDYTGMQEGSRNWPKWGFLANLDRPYLDTVNFLDPEISICNSHTQ